MKENHVLSLLYSLSYPESHVALLYPFNTADGVSAEEQSAKATYSTIPYKLQVTEHFKHHYCRFLSR
jgi:hypothetical protein